VLQPSFDSFVEKLNEKNKFVKNNFILWRNYSVMQVRICCFVNLSERNQCSSSDVRTLHQQSYDLTPEKDMRVQNKPVSEVQNLCANERIDPDEEREKAEILGRSCCCYES
jgi:hypothetical protein